MYLYPIADRIENIHFLVAQTEADLTDEHNLCSVGVPLYVLEDRLFRVANGEDQTKEE